MEIPNLVREHLGGEPIEASVSLGDEDVVCVTPTRALLYRGEGLLSDESVETYSFDLSRFDVSQGRRKTKFVFGYVDGTDTFTVPSSRADSLLTLLLQGILRVGGVTDEDESVAGVFEFSELTLVVTDSRLVKHIGSTAWDDDYEVYDFDDVTGLEFEEGSVATQIVLTVDGRPQRIKAPNEEAAQVEQTLVQAMCTYYDVGSLEELTRVLGANAEPAADEKSVPDAPSTASGDIELDDGISPLVGGDVSDEQETTQTEVDDAAEVETDATATSPDSTGNQTESSTAPERSAERGVDAEPAGNTGPDAGTQSPPDTAQQSSVADVSESPSSDSGESGTDAGTTTADQATALASDVDAEDIAAIESKLEQLTEAVKRQNELLRQHDGRIADHDERIEQLIEELRRGR